jgi:hypothetical protein
MDTALVGKYVDTVDPLQEQVHLTISKTPSTVILSTPLYNVRCAVLNGYQINNPPVDINSKPDTTKVPFFITFQFNNQQISYGMNADDVNIGSIDRFPLYIDTAPSYVALNYSEIIYRAGLNIAGNDINNITVNVYNNDGSPADFSHNLKIFLTVLLYGYHQKDIDLPVKSFEFRNPVIPVNNGTANGEKKRRFEYGTKLFLDH